MSTRSRILLTGLDRDTALLCRVHLALAGFEVLEDDAPTPPDLVLLGEGAADDRSYRWGAAAVIAVISRAQEENRLAALRAGAADLLSTPFHPDALVGTVLAVSCRTAGELAAHRRDAIAKIERLRRLEAR
jgi:DNA-binding response OmpR family regulator